MGQAGYERLKNLGQMNAVLLQFVLQNNAASTLHHSLSDVSYFCSNSIFFVKCVLVKSKYRNANRWKEVPAGPIMTLVCLCLFERGEDGKRDQERETTLKCVKQNGVEKGKKVR